MSSSESTLRASTNTYNGKDNNHARGAARSYPPRYGGAGDTVGTSTATDEQMDEDEARWMSVFENSRTPTPNTQMSRHTRRPDAAFINSNGYSRNMTPPLPPLNEEHVKKIAGRHLPHGSTDSTAGLTALPRHAGMLHHTFAQRVFLAGKSDLLYNYVERHRRPWDFRTTRHGGIDLTTLQQMQKYVLQQKLVAQVRAIGVRGAWMEIGIGDTLKEYCQVLRDLEYMEEHAVPGRHDHAFIITTARPLEAQLLEEADLAKQSPGSRCAASDIAAPIRHFRRGSPCLRLVQRVCVMLLFAAALVLPYLIMTLVPGHLTRFIASCACVAVFAVGVASLCGKRNRALPGIALTVIYTAAVIIFVGVTPQHFAR